MAHTSSPFKLAASCPFATSSNWSFNGIHRDRPSYKMGPKARPRLSPCLGGSRFWERSSLKISSDTFSWSASLPPAEARFSLCFDRRVSEDIGESGGLWVRGGWYWGLTGLTGTASTSSPGTTWTRSGMSMSSRRDSGECFSRSSSSLTESLRLLSRSRGPAWNTECWQEIFFPNLTNLSNEGENEPRPTVPETVIEVEAAKGNSETCLGFEEQIMIFVFLFDLLWICLGPGVRDLSHPGQERRGGNTVIHCYSSLSASLHWPLWTLEWGEAEEVMRGAVAYEWQRSWRRSDSSFFSAASTDSNSPFHFLTQANSSNMLSEICKTYWDSFLVNTKILYFLKVD